MVLDANYGIEPETSEEVCAGLMCEWFSGKQMVAYRLTAVSEKIIHTWADYVVSVLKTWDKKNPYLALHDLSQPGVSLQFATLVSFETTNIGITKDGQHQADKIMDDHPEFFGLVAVNFNFSVSGQVNKVLSSRRMQHPFVKSKAFYSRASALQWLSDSRKSVGV